MKKKRGFDALAPDIKKEILELMCGDTKKKFIAAKYDIPYSTFCQWCQKDWIR